MNGETRNAAFAVIDGHGGQHTADYVKSRLVSELLQEIDLRKNVAYSIKQGKFYPNSSEAFQLSFIRLTGEIINVREGHSQNIASK